MNALGFEEASDDGGNGGGGDHDGLQVHSVLCKEGGGNEHEIDIEQDPLKPVEGVIKYFWTL